MWDHREMANSRHTTSFPDLGRALLAGDRAVRALGITVEVTAIGAATARCSSSEDLGNGHGTVHGGYLFTLADTAFAYAINSHGRPGVSVHADVAFLHPARVGAVLSAYATERTFDGRAGIYDIEVLDDAHTLLAEIRIHGRIPSTRTS
jgi:acyl-CoA thioesterase